MQEKVKIVKRRMKHLKKCRKDLKILLSLNTTKSTNINIIHPYFMWLQLCKNLVFRFLKYTELTAIFFFLAYLDILSLPPDLLNKLIYSRLVQFQSSPYCLNALLNDFLWISEVSTIDPIEPKSNAL